MTINEAKGRKLTEFNYVAIDGTIVKTYNSNKNFIYKKDVLLLKKNIMKNILYQKRT
ncbi:hypothetical protein [Methanosphaera sp.]